MEHTCILRGRGYDVYRVTKGFEGLTYQEITNLLNQNLILMVLINRDTILMDIVV